MTEHQQPRYPLPPVCILWDYENVPVPKEIKLTGTQIVRLLRERFTPYGAILEIKVFASSQKIPDELRRELETSSVSCIDASSGGAKNFVDQMIFTHMFMFALDHPPPSTVVLISGDVDYAIPLGALALRGFKTILVAPNHVSVNSKLSDVPHHTFFWRDILSPSSLARSTEIIRKPSAPPSPAVPLHAAAATPSPTKAVRQGQTPSSIFDDPADESSESSYIVDELSEAASEDHLLEFFTVLRKLQREGQATPKLSLIGVRGHDIFPQVFIKGATQSFIEKARQHGIRMEKKDGGGNCWLSYDIDEVNQYLDKNTK